MFAGILTRPFGWLALAVIFGATTLLVLGRYRKHETRAFAGSCALIVGLLAALASGVYPVILHSTLDERYSLTARAAASNPFSLRLALFWWPVAFVLAIVYFTFIARQYRGKVRPSQDNQGFY